MCRHPSSSCDDGSEKEGKSKKSRQLPEHVDMGSWINKGDMFSNSFIVSMAMNGRRIQSVSVILEQTCFDVLPSRLSLAKGP